MRVTAARTTLRDGRAVARFWTAGQPVAACRCLHPLPDLSWDEFTDQDWPSGCV
jgi:hypothetical protein